MARAALVLGVGIAMLSACASLREPSRPAAPRELEVEATAYNSLSGQAHGDPRDTAFGRRLAPGMRVIAVSDDLYEQGLREGVRVQIEGLPGEWEVGDRMASRWRRRIDIYMGDDEQAARAWGKRRVRIKRR